MTVSQILMIFCKMLSVLAAWELLIQVLELPVLYAGMYHVACSGIPDSCLKQFLDLAKHVSWVCENCRVTVNSTVQRLRAEVSMLSESVAQLQSDVAEIKSTQFQSQSHRQQDQVITAEPGIVTLHSLPSANDLSAAVPVVEVERVINNINRRKSNIIVSGLAEVSNVSDTDAFQQLCEDYLECKPFVVSSRRIGQHSTDKPRRLLVRLRDEQSAAAILRSSRRLRSADNEAVSKSVFINPDLTPAAAKLAFEERQKRRQRRAAHKTQSDLGTQPVAIPSNVITTKSYATTSSDQNHPGTSSTHHETHSEQLMSDDATGTDGTVKQTTLVVSSSQHPDHASVLNPAAAPFPAS